MSQYIKSVLKVLALLAHGTALLALIEVKGLLRHILEQCLQRESLIPLIFSSPAVCAITDLYCTENYRIL